MEQGRKVSRYATLFDNLRRFSTRQDDRVTELNAVFKSKARPDVPPSDGSCPFLKIPTELRLVIYDFVFDKDLNKSPPRPVRPKVYYGLYRCCPKVHDEVRPRIVKDLDEWSILASSTDVYLRSLADMYLKFLKTELIW